MPPPSLLPNANLNTVSNQRMGQQQTSLDKIPKTLAYSSSQTPLFSTSGNAMQTTAVSQNINNVSSHFGVITKNKVSPQSSKQSSLGVKKEPSPPQPNKKTPPKSSFNNVPVSNTKVMDSISAELSNYRFKLCCDQCLEFTSIPWQFRLKELRHYCLQHKLAIYMGDKDGESVWFLVRERLSHRNFQGGYILCHSITFKDSKLCHKGDQCSFAHNPLEQFLWQKEKAGVFSISDFITKHKQQTSPRQGSMTADSVRELISMYPGSFCYICRRCFFNQAISTKGNGGICVGKDKHSWNTNQVLAHVFEGRYTLIDPPKFNQPTAYYRLCRFEKFCHRWSLNRYFIVTFHF